MRSAELDLNKYQTDKIEVGYLEKYDPVFEHFVDKKINLLELGVKEGASLLLWKDYFPQATITGIDIYMPEDFTETERIHLFQGTQVDTVFLSGVANKMAPNGFEIIIDDASHMGELTKISFWHLFDNHLKPGGWYVIEDWGTGYWDDFPDGKSLNFESYATTEPNAQSLWRKVARRLGIKSVKPWPSHSYGMVGLIKQLVDEQAASDVSRSAANPQSKRQSKFQQMIITSAVVFIKKADGYTK